MLIWGVRWKTVPLGQVAYHCSNCVRSTVHTALVERGKITVFFIPMIPIGTRYMIVCNLCGLRLKAVANLKEQLQELERTGEVRTPTPNRIADGALRKS
jgi:hypothetical protein